MKKKRNLVKIELIFLIITILFSLFGFILISYDGNVGNAITGFAEFNIYPIEESQTRETTNETYLIPIEEEPTITEEPTEQIGILPIEENIIQSESFDFIIMDAPTQGTPILNSTDPTKNDTDQNLTCWNQSTADADSDTVTNIYNWYRDNVSIMKLYMPFEANGSGNGTTDYSDQGNDGINYGATWSSTCGVDGAGAYEFCKTSACDDYIDLTNHVSTLDDYSNGTISLWFKSSASSTNTLLFGISDKDTANDLLQLGVANGWSGSIADESLTLSSYRSGSAVIDSYVCKGDGYYNDGIWHHFAYVMGSNFNKVYIDGTEETISYLTGSSSTGNYFLNVPNADFAAIGVRYISSSKALYFNGTIDDFRIYNFTLSAAQIKRIYENDTHVIVSNETSTGDHWHCEVTPNDGTEDGAAKNSSELKILALNPTTTLNKPIDSNETAGSVDVEFNCSATSSDFDLTNITLYGNWTGTWHANETATLSGTSDSTTFKKNVTKHKWYVWNCLTYNTQANSDFADSNYTFFANSMPTQGTPILNSTSPSVNDTHQNLTCWNQSTADAEDAVNNIYNWYLNDASIMKAYLPFEENGTDSASTTAKDYSGNSNDGAVTSATFNSTAGVNGRGAYEFDGINDIIKAGDFDFTTEFTITAWIYPKDTVIRRIISKWDGSSVGTDDGAIIIDNYDGSSDGGGLRAWIYDTNDAAQMSSASGDVLLTNQWNFIAVTFNSGDFVVYLNYTNVSNGALGHTTLDNNAFVWGIGEDGSEASGSEYFNGTIDEVRFYNVSLSKDQIRRLYENDTHIIVSNETSIDDSWKCEVTPNDGAIDGTSKNSSALTILTSNPIISAIAIEPDPAYTDSLLHCNITITDADADSMTVYMNWTNGTTHYAEYSKTSVSTGDKLNFTLTPSGIQARMETWNCSAMGHDGSNFGDMESTTIEIGDAVPPPKVSGLEAKMVTNEFIFWEWTNPTNDDFNHTEVRINNVFKENTSDTKYLAYYLDNQTEYTITLMTTDEFGNTNTTQQNDTQKTYEDYFWSHFFIQNSTLNRTDNLTITILTATRDTANNPVFSGAYTWDSFGVCYSDIIYNYTSKTYKAWFLAVSTGSSFTPGYISFTNESSWGNTETQVTTDTGSGWFAVYYDEDETNSSRRYKALYDRATDNADLYYSSDETGFTKHMDIAGVDEPTQIFKRGDEWVMLEEDWQNENSRELRYFNATEENGTWTEQKVLFSTADAKDQPYIMRSYFECPDSGCFYIGFVARYNSTSKLMEEMELVYSDDLYNWTTTNSSKTNATDILTIWDSDIESWENNMTWPNTLIPRPDKYKWQLFYDGANFKHDGSYSNLSRQIGLADWDYERIGYIGENGNFTTDTITLAGNATITFNVNSTSGTLKAELLDSDGNVISGYEESSFTAIAENNFMKIGNWSGVHKIPTTAKQIRVYLNNSKLYSMKMYTLNLESTITLVYPVNDSTPTTSSINFTYKVTDPGDTINNCTLWLTDTDGSTLLNNKTDTGITQDINQTFNLSLANGKYDWLVSCRDDGNLAGNSTQYNFSVAVVTNVAPEVHNVTIEPSTAYTDTLLHCNTTIYDSDSGDTLTVNMTWWVNNSIYYSKYTNSSGITGGYENFTLTPGVQQKDETWNCSVIVNDGTVDSLMNSTTITILNTAPVSGSVTFEPTTAYTDSILNGTITVTDTDSDTIITNATWYNGSAAYISANITSAASAEFNYSLTEGVQIKGETWNISFVSCDDSGSCDSASATKTITNTAPTTPTIGNPVNESRQIGNSVTLNCGSSTDPDEADTIYYEFYGDEDTNPPTTLKQNTTGTTYAWTTKDGSTYWWRCRANDAEDASSYTTIKQFVENNLSIVTNITLNPTIAYTNLTIDGSIIVYDSEDSLTVYLNWTNGTTHYSEYSKTSVSTGSSVNFTLAPEIQHRGETWNFTARLWDGYELSLFNSTFINISNYRPELALIDPANNTDSTTHYTNFTYNVSDIDEVVNNCTLWLEQVNDSTGLIVNATNKSITLDVNQSFEVNLSHGYHNWLIECTDDENNKTNSSQWTYHVLNDYPLITQIKPLNNTYVGNGTISFEFNISDQDYIINCSLTVDNAVRNTLKNTTATGLARIPSSHTLTYGLQSGSNHNYSITCCDMYDKCNLTANYTFHISQPYFPSPSQGSAGSSGGGASGGRSEQATEVVGTNIILPYLAPAPLRIKLNDPNLIVSEVIIEIAKEASDVSVDIKEPTTIPIEKPGLEVFKYLQIETVNLPDSFVSEVYIKFKVPKSAVKDKKVEVLHYNKGTNPLNPSSGVWDKIFVKLVSNDELFNYYEAISPGLSYYAITLRDLTSLEKIPLIFKIKPKVVIEKLGTIKQQIKDNYILIITIAILVFLIIMVKKRRKK